MSWSHALRKTFCASGRPDGLFLHISMMRARTGSDKVSFSKSVNLERAREPDNSTARARARHA